MKKLCLTMTVLALAGALCAAPARGKKNAAKAPKAPAAQTIAFALPSVRSGSQWSTADYAGTPLLVAVVSSGCPHCQKTLPQLEEARKTLRNVQVVAVFVDGAPKAPLVLLNKDSLRFDAVYNGMETARRLKVDGVPMLFLFDARHRLIKTFDGYSENRVKELKDAADGLEKEVSMVSLEAE